MWPNHRDQKQKISGFLALSVLVHIGIIAGVLYYNFSGPGPEALPTSPIQAGVSALEVVEIPKGDPQAIAQPDGVKEPKEFKASSKVVDFATAADGEVELPKTEVQNPKPIAKPKVKAKRQAKKKTIKKATPKLAKTLPKKLPNKLPKKLPTKLPTKLPGRKAPTKASSAPTMAAVIVPDSDVAANSAQSIAPGNKVPKEQPVSSFEQELDEGIDGDVDLNDDPELQKALKELNASESVNSFDEDPEADALERDLNALLDGEEPIQEKPQAKLPVAKPKKVQANQTTPKRKAAPLLNSTRGTKGVAIAKGPKLTGTNVAKPGSLEGLRTADSLKQYPGNRPPAYPQRDRLRRKQGQVTLTAYVTAQGRPKNIKIVQSSGTSRMNANAQRAFSKYRFYSGQQGMVRQTYIFRLSGDTQDLPARLGSR